VFAFGKRILSLYGEHFSEAYVALCIVAIGSSCWTLFSLAPSLLLFVGERRALLTNLIVHGILLISLTLLLFGNLGHNGAAIAYAISISSLAIFNLLLANRCLGRRTQLPEATKFTPE
jgi:O-antigen/teichoic acid export membrane protein